MDVGVLILRICTGFLKQPLSHKMGSRCKERSRCLGGPDKDKNEESMMLSPDLAQDPRQALCEPRDQAAPAASTHVHSPFSNARTQSGL